MTSIRERRSMHLRKVDSISIGNAGDYDEVFELAEHMCVDLEGLEELDEMKERLLMHLNKDDFGNERDAIIRSMTECQKDDNAKRQKLTEVLEQCYGKLLEFAVPECRRGSSAIEHFLKVEGVAKDFKKDFFERIQYMKSGDCVIVVSGETSAGKSRAVNLLLGQEILPVHHNSCTSVITRIYFSQEFSACIVYQDGRKEYKNDLSNIKDDLWGSIYTSDIKGRDQVSEIKEVQIGIKSPILKCGIVVVDSPGVGENEAMDSVIANFVEDNDISGFLYIIKSDNSGGVDEDRLLSLVKLVIEKQKKKSSESFASFDPKAAVFVCNRWDLITNPEHQDETYKNAFEKLSQCWPGLEEKQVIRMSVSRAERELKVDKCYITSQFKTLLESIRDVLQKATQNKVHSTYRWLERLLARSVHHLKTMVKVLDMSEQEMEDRMQIIHDRLQALKNKSTDVLEVLRTRLEDKYQELCDDFRKHLQDPASRTNIKYWIDLEVPEKKEGMSWETLKSEIDSKIGKRITETLIEWEKSEGRLQSIQDMVVNDIKLQLRIFQDELIKIEKDCESDSFDDLSVAISPTLTKSGRRSFQNIFSTLPDKQKQTLNALSTKFANMTEEFDVPTKLAVRITKPFARFFNKSSYKSKSSKKRIEQYVKEPCKVMSQRAEKMLGKLVKRSDGDILQLYITHLMNKPLLYLKFLEENIPSMIESNEKALDHVGTCRVDAKECRTLYETLMEALEFLKHGLLQFGQGSIFVEEMNEIFISDGNVQHTTASKGSFHVSDFLDRSSSDDETTICTNFMGLWTVLQPGFIKNNALQEDITIKIYLSSSGVEHTYPEVAKLRFLEHASVAKFKGIHHSDTKTPAFIYEEVLQSAKKFLSSAPSEINTHIGKIVCETITGLEYLHSKNMVHMELSQNTITVDVKGNVKLTGACLPRCAMFPLDKNEVEVGDFVYLSPEVLKGELYISCSDVYAFGLFLLELIFNITAFKDQRQHSLEFFAQNLDTNVMLDLAELLLEVPPFIAKLVKECLKICKDERPQMGDAKKIICQSEDISCCIISRNISGTSQKKKGKNRLQNTRL